MDREYLIGMMLRLLGDATFDTAEEVRYIRAWINWAAGDASIRPNLPKVDKVYSPLVWAAMALEVPGQEDDAAAQIMHALSHSKTKSRVILKTEYGEIEVSLFEYRNMLMNQLRAKITDLFYDEIY